MGGGQAGEKNYVGNTSIFSTKTSSNIKMLNPKSLKSYTSSVVKNLEKKENSRSKSNNKTCKLNPTKNYPIHGNNDLHYKTNELSSNNLKSGRTEYCIDDKTINSQTHQNLTNNKECLLKNFKIFNRLNDNCSNVNKLINKPYFQKNISSRGDVNNNSRDFATKTLNDKYYYQDLYFTNN